MGKHYTKAELRALNKRERYLKGEFKNYLNKKLSSVDYDCQTAVNQILDEHPSLPATRIVFLIKCWYGIDETFDNAWQCKCRYDNGDISDLLR